MKPKDWIAAITLVFVFLFKYNGYDGSLDAALALILGYYFVKRQNGQDNGR